MRQKVTRYTKAQKVRLAEFREWARKGDRVLGVIVSALVDKYSGDNNLKGSLISNSVISNFHIPARFKINLPKRSYKPAIDGIKGDMVEAYIWFLHLNYGTAAVERYVIKNFKQIVDKI